MEFQFCYVHEPLVEASSQLSLSGNGILQFHVAVALGLVVTLTSEGENQ